jgi:hypothetical protein
LAAVTSLGSEVVLYAKMDKTKDPIRVDTLNAKWSVSARSRSPKPSPSLSLPGR